jgi:hypothetical protein
MRQGIRNPLVLSNLAISTYQRVVLSGAVNDEPLERVS